MACARVKAGTTIAAIVAALLGVGAASGSVEQRSFAPGDSLIYDFNLEVQMHVIGASAQSSTTSDVSGSGTETLAIDRVDAAGDAYGLLSIAYQGTANGQAVSVARSWRAMLTTEGEIQADGTQPSLGDDLDQALSFFNGVTRGLGDRVLAPGTTWKTAAPADLPSEKLTVVNRVTGVQPYQKFSATVIQQTSQGQFATAISGAPAEGTIATGGTVYYDAALGLLVGCAVRGQTDVAITAADVKHISKTEIVNVQLRAWNLGSPNPAAPASPGPTAAPSATDSPSAAPAYTSTPSPIATGR